MLAALDDARGTVVAAVEQGLAAAGRLVPAPLERGLAALWLSLSVLALALIFAVHMRFRRARRAWPVAELHGTRVRLAPNAGPAVAGLARPEIVVPRWLLGRSEDEQRLVLAHEREHLRARDPLLLAAACLAVALVPWHPAAWWMLSRLRLAMELDCDERVIRSGVAARSYGALLIELAGHCSSGMRIGAPALADESTHLKRRLLAMTPRRPRFTRASGTALIACALVLFVLACDARLPSSGEIEAMDVSAAESAAHHLALVGPADSLVTYMIDGRKATAAEARALGSDDIATIEVMKKKRGESASGEVRIITKRAADSLGIVGMRERSDGSPRAITVVRRDTITGAPGALATRLSDTVVFTSSGPSDGVTVERKPFSGVLLIDGVRADNKALASLPRDAIVSVEVVKGEAARKIYADSAAANGVISVTTRSAVPKE